MIEALFLVPLLVIGLAASYADLIYKKIPNFIIAAGLIYSFLLYISLFIYNGIFIKIPENIHYLINGSVNGLIGFLVGFLIWDRRLWSAGDAKLFALYAFLLPLEFYSKHYISWFPSINLLINLFVPLVGLLVLAAFFFFLRASANWFLKFIKNPGNYFSWPKILLFLKDIYLSFSLLLFIFIFFRLISFCFSRTFLSAIFSNPFFIFFFMVFLSGKLINIISRRSWLKATILLFLPIFCLYLLLSANTGFVLSTLKMALYIWIFFILVRRSLDFYIRSREMCPIPLASIGEGSIICEEDSAIIEEILRVTGRKEEFGEVMAEGLTKKQALILQEVSPRREPFLVKTYRTFPFAPYLLLAALICFFTKTSLIALIATFF